MHPKRIVLKPHLDIGGTQIKYLSKSTDINKILLQ